MIYGVKFFWLLFFCVFFILQKVIFNLCYVTALFSCFSACLIRTTKRPVPLEHCLFYSGEFYKVCENETFIPQGWKAAKDAHKKKNSSAFGGATGTRSYAGSSASRDGARAQKLEHPNRGKQNKHSGSQNTGNFSGSSGNQNNGGSKNNWGSRRSEASIWLPMINKLSKKSLLPVRRLHCKTYFNIVSLVDSGHIRG